jgi:predicted transcriptional regulator
MAQFDCDVCGEGFEQLSRLKRHMMTSHPPQAVNASDLAGKLKGLNFPMTKNDIVNNLDDEKIINIIRKLPDKEYRDAAEVTRAFGEIKSHQKKPTDKPSKKGGAQALKSLSASKIAILFKGIKFPASKKELEKHVSDKANEAEMDLIRKFSTTKTYHNMADIEKEFGALS